MSNSILAIIGAGPKALAILAKASLLKQLGYSVPHFILIDKQGVAAHWKQGTGYTTGQLRLGTPPEKDVGFPYSSTCWGDSLNATINKEMLNYSWGHFLIEQNKYASWVDRGKPHPTHSVFASYLEWVYQKSVNSGLSLEYIEGDFQTLSFSKEKDHLWNIGLEQKKGNPLSRKAHALILTGPGEIRQKEESFKHPQVLTLETFWPFFHSYEKQLDNTPHVKKNWAVIGNGETAASISVLLGKRSHELNIDIITSTPINYSRGESYFENNIYSDGNNKRWSLLTLKDRKDFIARTDRGVFSLATQKELDLLENISVHPGWFCGLSPDQHHDGVTINLQYDEKKEERTYDYVVLAMGLDPLSFLTHRLDLSTLEEIQRHTQLSLSSLSDVESAIEEDLSLRLLKPKIHLPMLAGPRQGPGMPNLSCLGLMADRILYPYISGELHGQK